MTSDRDRVHDRAYLLSRAKRDQILALWEVRRYGQDSFGDADYVSVYGLRPAEWYARGVRLLARTAVECTRDRLADLMAADIAEVATSAPTRGGPIVADPFAGSCNTLFWIGRRVRARRIVGFELDDGVFEATRRNLALVGSNIELAHQNYVAGLRHLAGLGDLGGLGDRLLIVFVAPPWGDALDQRSGLDLRRTQPPVGAVLDLVNETVPHPALLFAIQVYERTDADSLEQVAARFDWSKRVTYPIDEAGRNHGLVLGTRGWTPFSVRSSAG